MEPVIRPRVKICCMASAEEACLEIRHGAAALGLVSAMPSGPGVIGEELIAAIAATVPPGVSSFLLTSSQDTDAIVEQQRRCHVDTLQLVDRLERGEYGDLRDALPGVKLVQVIHIGQGNGEEAIEEAMAAAPFLRSAQDQRPPAQLRRPVAADQGARRHRARPRLGDQPPPPRGSPARRSPSRSTSPAGCTPATSRTPSAGSVPSTSTSAAACAPGDSWTRTSCAASSPRSSAPAPTEYPAQCAVATEIGKALPMLCIAGAYVGPLGAAPHAAVSLPESWRLRSRHGLGTRTNPRRRVAWPQAPGRGCNRRAPYTHLQESTSRPWKNSETSPTPAPCCT
jgi:hypothetical protein